jgi:uncharacterized protein (TIGR00369 family)
MSDDVRAEGARAPPEGFVTVDWTRGFGRQIGPLYRRDVEGRRRMGLFVEERHVNGMMNAHGGVLMTLADMAWGNVVSMERSAVWVTVRLVCDFLESAAEGDFIEGGGELVSEADGLYVVQGEVVSNGRRLVVGSGVFKAVRPRPPRPGEKAFRDGV